MIQSRCPRCHADLPPKESPQGLCPKCLIAVAMGESQVIRTGSGAPVPEPPSPEELAPSFPQLEILEVVGRGGMGVVYKARQRGLDRLVALKILEVAGTGDPAFAERFRREARAMAGLAHPNIAGVHDSGQAGDHYYLVMEFVDGPNLRQLITTHALAPAESMAIVSQICSALEYAHGEGVVHRDIKPENVLVDAKGRVKIVDFGLAKLLGRESPEPTLTRSHQAMGTWHYMAPEQVERPLDVDHRADIYSLGVVFYELLTGELPLGRFEAPSERVQVDVRLDEVVLRTLEKDRDRRYQHASEVKEQVEHISSTDAHADEESSWRERGRQFGEEMREMALGGGSRGAETRRAARRRFREKAGSVVFEHEIGVPHGVRQGMRTLITVVFWIFFGFACLLAVRMGRGLSTFNPFDTEKPSAPAQRSAARWPWPAGSLGLDEESEAQAARVVAEHFARYVAAEQEHTRLETISGDKIIAIDPFTDRVDAIESSMELELATVLDPDSLDEVLQTLPRDQLFPFGGSPRQLVIRERSSGLGTVFDVAIKEPGVGRIYEETFPGSLPWYFERFLPIFDQAPVIPRSTQAEREPRKD